MQRVYLKCGDATSSAFTGKRNLAGGLRIRKRRLRGGEWKKRSGFKAG
jgi:hypothetical protein